VDELDDAKFDINIIKYSRWIRVELYFNVIKQILLVDVDDSSDNNDEDKTGDPIAHVTLPISKYVQHIASQITFGCFNESMNKETTTIVYNHPYDYSILCTRAMLSTDIHRPPFRVIISTTK
jgi:hypothetical protein